MFNKLNGWQRLWVVFSTFLFIVMALLTYFRLPPRYYDAFEIAAYEQEECTAVKDHIYAKWHMTHKNEILDPDVFDLLSDPEYQVCLDKAKLKQQATFVVRAFLVWLGIVAFIYGAGFSFAWVRKGFRGI
jgi:hypothetical protein